MDPKFLEDMFSRLKAAQSQTSPAAQPAAPAKVVTLGEALETAVPDHIKRQKVYDEIVERTISKLLRTTDIATLRVASLSDRMVERRNTQTPFLNYLESQGAPAIINDYHHEWQEIGIGQQEAEFFNHEEALPGSVNGNRSKRRNTMGCIGNRINVSILVEEMARQQLGFDLMAQELDYEVTRIRRKMNSVLLDNDEVMTEGPFNIPQPHGFITASTLYNVDNSGNDLTRSLLQSRVDAIANDADPEGWGYGLQLLAFTNARQLQVIHDIVISEYNGIDPMSHLAYDATLRAKLSSFGVPVEAVFAPKPGRVIPFVLDSMLPDGTTVIFDAEKPRLAKMRLNGQLGPFVLARPTERMITMNVVFDLFSLEDPAVDTRSIITNHG